MGFFTFSEVINAKIIKAHTVDQTFGIYQTKETRLVITWLWTWRDGTDPIDPNPIAPNASMHSPSLSRPAARPSGFLNVRPMQLTGFAGTFCRTSASNGVPVIRRNC